MKLTREQRNYIYKELLKIFIERGFIKGKSELMCIALIEMTNLKDIPKWWEQLCVIERMNLLPELKRYKPFFVGRYGKWAPLNYRGYIKRMKWIVGAIEKSGPKTEY